jgi:hypothetical protein
LLRSRFTFYVLRFTETGIVSMRKRYDPLALLVAVLCLGLGGACLVGRGWPARWSGVMSGLSVTLVGLTAFWLGRPWRFASAADRWLLWALFAASEIVVVEETLSLFHALWPHTLLAAEALLAAMSWRMGEWANGRMGERAMGERRRFANSQIRRFADSQIRRRI